VLHRMGCLGQRPSFWRDLPGLHFAELDSAQVSKDLRFTDFSAVYH